MSFHELISGYPWLSKRMSRVLADGKDVRFPRRSIFAWILALFVPSGAGGAAGAGGSVLVMVAIIGILAAVALPAYQDYTVRAKIAGGIMEGHRAATAVRDYFSLNNAIPTTLAQAGYSQLSTDPSIQSVSVDPQSGVVSVRFSMRPVEGQSIMLVPTQGENKKVIWKCKSEDVSPRYLPVSCR